jgi:hypothetical protein
VERPCRTDRPAEEDHRTVRGEEKTVNQPKQAQHRRRVTGKAVVQIRRHKTDVTARPTSDGESSPPRLPYSRVNAAVMTTTIKDATMMYMPSGGGHANSPAASVIGTSFGAERMPAQPLQRAPSPVCLMISRLGRRLHPPTRQSTG